jgi:hypothetical protein
LAYVIKDSTPKDYASPLSLAPLDRAKDTLVLARLGSPAMKRQWNTFVEENPDLARVVTKWADSERAEQAKATRVADRMLERAEYVTKGLAPAVTKGSKRAGQCLKCGHGLKAKWRRCPECGAKSKVYVPPEGGEVMPKKKARKTKAAGGTLLLTKAAKRREFAAMAPSIYDPDPAVAEVAWRIRRGEMRWAPPGVPG